MEDMIAKILSGTTVPTWPRWAPPLAVVGEGSVAQRDIRFRAPPAGAMVWVDVDDLLNLYLGHGVLNVRATTREQLRRHYPPRDIRFTPEAGGINALAAMVLLRNGVEAGRLAAQAVHEFLRSVATMYEVAPNWPTRPGYPPPNSQFT